MLFFANHIMKILKNGSLRNTWSTNYQDTIPYRIEEKTQKPKTNTRVTPDRGSVSVG